MFTKDPQFWQAMRNTLWIIAVGLPLELAFAMATAMMLTRPRRGHRVYRTVYFLPTLAPPVAAALAFVFILKPLIGPVNQVLRGLGVITRRSGSRPVDLEVGPRVPRPVGRGADDDHLPRGPPGTCPAHLYEAADMEGSGSVAEVPVRDVADDVAGRLLLARDRRDAVPVSKAEELPKVPPLAMMMLPAPEQPLPEPPTVEPIPEQTPPEEPPANPVPIPPVVQPSEEGESPKIVPGQPEEQPSEPTPEAGPEEEPVTKFETMTKPELVAYARDTHGTILENSMKKDAMIQAIIKMESGA